LTERILRLDRDDVKHVAAAAAHERECVEIRLILLPLLLFVLIHAVSARSDRHVLSGHLGAFGGPLVALLPGYGEVIIESGNKAFRDLVVNEHCGRIPSTEGQLL